MLAIYVHIPFCLKKCEHCDFFSVPVGRGDVPHEAYLAAIMRQLERNAPLFEGRGVSTIYFGGGTPSLMPPVFFKDVLAQLARHFTIDADAEVSCEVNPATVDGDWFRAAQDAGITRCSIGVQSFQPHLLTTLGRIHTADDAMRTIAEAQDAGFKSVSLDLMYAIMGETIPDLENDLRTATTFQPDHVSAYALTIEEGTPFAFRASGLPDEDEQLRQMQVVARMLSRGGWPRYEISNFARPGHECRHNLNYWRYGEYLGLGAGATSFIRPFVRSSVRPAFGRRWAQIRDVAAYLDGTGALAEDETIDDRTAMGEFCFLGLRTTEGISEQRFEELFGVFFESVFSEERRAFVERGLLAEADGRLALTPRGVELSNQVFEKFVADKTRMPPRDVTSKVI